MHDVGGDWRCHDTCGWPRRAASPEGRPPSRRNSAHHDGTRRRRHHVVHHRATRWGQWNRDSDSSTPDQSSSRRKGKSARSMNWSCPPHCHPTIAHRGQHRGRRRRIRPGLRGPGDLLTRWRKAQPLLRQIRRTPQNGGVVRRGSLLKPRVPGPLTGHRLRGPRRHLR